MENLYTITAGIKMDTIGLWDYPDARILIVDDSPWIIALAKQLLVVGGYEHVVTLSDSRTAVSEITSEKYDLVLLDLQMPYVDGYEILRKVAKRGRKPDSFVPILIFTSDSSKEARQQALDLGANDFIIKPFDQNELLLRVRNFLRMRLMHLSLLREKQELDKRVQERTAELLIARSEALDCLARAMEYRDNMTGGHTQRVGAMSARIAQELGLGEDLVETLRITSPLHDVGKIGISDDILARAGSF